MAKTEELRLRVRVDGEDDVKDLSDDIEDLFKKVDKLTSTPAELVLTSKFGKIRGEMADLAIKLEELDDSDPEVEITIDRLNQLQGDLDAVVGKIKEIDDAKPEVTVTTDTSQVEQGLGRAKRGAEDLSDSARGSRNALANMVGNSAQELGAFTGIAGGAGVALGQLAEFGTDAKLAGEGLGSVLKGVGSTVLPIAAVGVGVGLIGSAMQRSKADAEALNAAIDNFSSSLEDSVGAAEALDAAIEAAFETGAGSPLAVIAKSFQDAIDPKKIDEYRIALSGLDLVNSQYVEGLMAGEGSFRDFAESQLVAAGATQEQAEAIAASIDSQESYNEIVQTLLGSNRDWAESQQGLIEGLEALDDVAGSLNIEDMAQDFLSAQRGVEGETAAVDEALRTTDSYGDALLAYIRIKKEANAADQEAITRNEQFAALTERNAAAQEAAAEATKATAEEQDRMTFSTEELTAALLGQQDPLNTLPAQWDALITDFRDGVSDTETFTERINLLADATDKEPGEILAIVTEQAAAADEALASTTEAMRQFGIETGTAASRAEGISDAFERLNAASQLEATQEVIDFADALSGLADSVTELDEADLEGINLGQIDIIPDTWDEVLNMPEELGGVVDAIAGMREQVQSELAQAFERGGPEEAMRWAQSYREGVVEALRAAGIESTDVINQILAELGILDDTQVEATIALAHEEQVLNALATITSGIQGIPASTAFDIQMAINNNDPATALQLINDYLISIGQEPVVVDIAVSDNGTAATTGEGIDAVAEPREAPVDAVAETAAAATELLDLAAEPRSALIVAIANTQGAYAALTSLVNHGTVGGWIADVFARTQNVEFSEATLNNLARDRTADIYTVVHGAGGGTAGGGNPGPGGQAAVGPATMATATPMAASTSSISPVTMTPYVAPVQPINVTINAGVLGNHFDVERTVARALRRHQRVNGRR